MTSKVFEDGNASIPVDSAWLNDINNHAYNDSFIAAQTAVHTAVKIAFSHDELGLGSDVQTAITSVDTKVNNVVTGGASGIALTPAGNISATNVQAGIYELDAEKAPIASPALTGTPTVPTAVVGTNSTQVASTAFVLANSAVLSNSLPLMDGTAASGVSVTASRQDHKHPTDSTKANIASPIFTGTPSAPTASVGNSSTQLATTAFVFANSAVLSNITPLMDGTASAGVATASSRDDHKHPSDTSKANLVSPAFTGVPTTPTASLGTNTTQVASTAFVQANASVLSNAAPLMDGVAAAGVATSASRNDHIHPSDTAKANLVSPAFTGTPTVPTAAPGTNNTQVASTAFVQANANAAPFITSCSMPARVANTVYTNTTGKTMFVTMKYYVNSINYLTATATVYVAGVVATSITFSVNVGMLKEHSLLAFMVPNGATYQVTLTGTPSPWANVTNWTETY